MQSSTSSIANRLPAGAVFGNDGSIKSWLVKGTTMVVVLMPVIFPYKSPIPVAEFNLALFLYVIWSVIAVVSTRGVFFVDSPFVPYIAYIAIVTPIAFLLLGLSSLDGGGSFAAFIARWIKCLYLLGAFFLFGLNRLFSRRYAMNVLCALGFATSVMLAVQHVAFNVGFPFDNPLAFLYTDDILLHISSRTDFYRPSAFFDEPSTISLVFLPLVIDSLFSSKEKVDVRELILGSLPIILSISSMGIIAVFLLFSAALLWRLSHRPLVALLFTVVIIVAVLSLSKHDYFQVAIERVFTSNTADNAVAARSGSEAIDLFASASTLTRFLGVGFGNLFLSSYTNGWVYCLVTLGVIGTAIFMISLVRIIASMIRKRRSEGVMMVLSFAALMLGVQLVEPIRFCFWFACAGEDS